MPPHWRAGTPSETDLCIRSVWGGEIWVIGLDKPDRMEGVPWDGGIVDEISTAKASIWEANIRPALSTVGREGWCWLIGVPDMAGPGQADYLKLYDKAVTKENGEWDLYSWPSQDILSASEIESARRDLDPRMFAQEYMGQFVALGGLAFPDFDQKVHAAKPVPYDPALPLCWSLDFNINPMCSGVIQHHQGNVRVIKEFTLPDTRTDTACDTFLGYAKEHNWNLTNLSIYGDATGNARDTTSGITDWYIVANRMKNIPGKRIKVPPANPNIKDTVNSTNAKVKSADGQIHLSIDPSCKGLIGDLRSALAGTDMEPQHHVSWFRYFCHEEFPVGGAVPISGAVVFPSRPQR